MPNATMRAHPGLASPSRRGGKGEDGAPSPIDRHVGARIKLRRMLLGLSQEQLGGALGITFQQVQKYERGINRVGASRLFDLTRILDVPVDFFFDDLPEALRAAVPSRHDGAAAQAQLDQEAETLVTAYYAIADRKVRSEIYQLAKALAAAEARDGED